MSNATRKLERPPGTFHIGISVKSRDGWWARKRAEFAERKLQEKRDAEWRERVANGMEE